MPGSVKLFPTTTMMMMMIMTMIYVINEDNCIYNEFRMIARCFQLKSMIMRQQLAILFKNHID